MYKTLLDRVCGLCTGASNVQAWQIKPEFQRLETTFLADYEQWKISTLCQNSDSKLVAGGGHKGRVVVWNITINAGSCLLAQASSPVKNPMSHVHALKPGTADMRYSDIGTLHSKYVD